MAVTRQMVGTAVAALAICAGTAHADPIGWPQPDGPGSPVYLTYSYSNLLDSSFNTVLTPAELRAATEAAFMLWASYAPLHFIETHTYGPAASETDYPAAGTANIRIGQLSALADGAVAHVHLPFARDGGATGLSGDIHFSNDLSLAGYQTWGRASDGALVLDFFSAMLHEAGHATGLLHLLGATAIMGNALHIFPDHETADLFPADIAAIRALYGAGVGSVRPLADTAVPTPEPASVLLIVTGLGACGVGARRRRRARATRKSSAA